MPPSPTPHEAMLSPPQGPPTPTIQSSFQGAGSSLLSCRDWSVLWGLGLSDWLESGAGFHSPGSAGPAGPGWDGGDSLDGRGAGGSSEGSSFLGLWPGTWEGPPCSSKVVAAREQCLPLLKLKSCWKHVHVRRQTGASAASIGAG